LAIRHERLSKRAFRRSRLIRPLLIAIAIGLAAPLAALVAALWTLLS